MRTKAILFMIIMMTFMITTTELMINVIAVTMVVMMMTTATTTTMTTERIKGTTITTLTAVTAGFPWTRGWRVTWPPQGRSSTSLTRTPTSDSTGVVHLSVSLPCLPSLQV